MNKLAPQPIRRRRLYQDVMDNIIAAINNGSFRPGDRLPSERELMDTYGVGRPAIREALQNMARMGLVSLMQGERARVAEPSFTQLMQSVTLTTSSILRSSGKSLEDLKEARLVFEVEMVRLATLRATSDDIARLEDRHEAHVASMSDLSDFLHHDMLFHREIATITGNSIFPVLSESLMGWLGEFYRELVRLPGAEQLTIAEHAEVLAGIRSKDPEKAEHAIRVHLTRANELYQRLADTSQLTMPRQ